MAQCLLLILALLLTKLLMNSFGLLHRNRAVHGDIVVVELLHKSQWKGRSISLKSKDQGTACCIQWPLVLKKLERANRAFSHDVMSAILVYQSNETEAMLVLQTNPLGVEPFSHVKSLFCSKNMHSC